VSFQAAVTSEAAQPGAGLPALMLAFLLCFVYGTYCWFRMRGNRRPGVSWWAAASADTLTDRGRTYLRRFLASLAAGALFIVLALILYPSH
jgi:hypothetical protein